MVERVVSTVSRIAAYVAAFVMACMTATVLLEIVVRTFFGTTTHAAEELVGFGLASLVFLALAHAMDRGSLIRVDLILVRLSGRLRRAVELVSIVVALTVTSFVGWYVFLAIVRYWNRNTVSAPSGLVPLWIPQSIVFLGIVLFCIQLIVYFARVARGGAYAHDDDAPELE